MSGPTVIDSGGTSDAQLIKSLRNDLAIAQTSLNECKNEKSHYYNQYEQLKRNNKQERFVQRMIVVATSVIVSLFVALIYGNIDRRADAELAARSWAIGSLGYPRQSTTAACRTGIMNQGTLCVVRNIPDGRVAFVNCDGARWNNDGCYPIRAQVYYGIGSVDALDAPATAANPR